MRNYYVSILASRSRVLYVGVTNDLFSGLEEARITPRTPRESRILLSGGVRIETGAGPGSGPN